MVEFEIILGRDIVRKIKRLNDEIWNNFRTGHSEKNKKFEWWNLK